MHFDVRETYFNLWKIKAYMKEKRTVAHLQIGSPKVQILIYIW